MQFLLRFIVLCFSLQSGFADPSPDQRKIARVSTPHIPLEVLEIITKNIPNAQQARAFQNLYRNPFFPSNASNNLVETVKKCQRTLYLPDPLRSGVVTLWGTACTKAILKLQEVYNPRKRRKFRLTTLQNLEKIDAEEARLLKWEHVEVIAYTYPDANLELVPWPRLMFLKEIQFRLAETQHDRRKLLSRKALESIPPVGKLQISGQAVNPGFFKDALETINAQTINLKDDFGYIPAISLKHATNLATLELELNESPDLLHALFESMLKSQLEKLTIRYHGESTLFTPAVLWRLSALKNFDCFTCLTVQPAQLIQHMPLLQTLSYTLERATSQDQYAPEAFSGLQHLKSLTVNFEIPLKDMAKLGRLLSTLPKLELIEMFFKGTAEQDEVQGLLEAMPQFLSKFKPFARYHILRLERKTLETI